MSHAGLLERYDVIQDDEWFEVVAPEPEIEAEPAGAPVLAAIFAAQEALSRGIIAQVTFDTDDLPELDELDDAAIHAFLNETD